MEGTSEGEAFVAAVATGLGIIDNVAAALAVARNSRREIGGVFMTGQYNGKKLRKKPRFSACETF